MDTWDTQHPKGDAGDDSQNDTSVYIAKRSAIRQRLAMALMAIGGVLLAGLFWYFFAGQKN